MTSPLPSRGVDWLVEVHHFLPPMLPLVGVSTLRSIFPIFDFPRLCEPLHAYVQASKTFPPLHSVV